MKTKLRKLGAISTVVAAVALLPVTGFGQASPTTRDDLTDRTATSDRGDRGMYGWVGLLGLLGLAGLTRKRDAGSAYDGRSDASRRSTV